MAQHVKWINWQRPMRHVLYACAPLLAFAVALFGWRVAALALTVGTAAYLAEAAFTRSRREPVSSAVFVSALLYTFSLPPALPFWMAGVGIVFGIVFGKMVYGGFGRNVFNPALTGRAFIYVSFGNAMTAQWSEPFRPFPAGLLRWGWSAASAPRTRSPAPRRARCSSSPRRRWPSAASPACPRSGISSSGSARV
jgi:Na+-transporting NADH:ubiquinone oxidoreductase subunit B